MKIRCDVCENGEASVFCVADEAALCCACDHRVHHANKLAGKHHRFSLLSPPPPKQFPVCDICQERRGFVFCQQDRAILCRECDVPIHKSISLSHNRFLFTGIKVSPNSALYSSSSSSSSLETPAESSRKSVPVPIFSNAVPNCSSHDSASNKEEINVKSPKSSYGSKEFSSEIGSIASMNRKYTDLDVLPDWSVEDFIDPFSPLVFSKSDCDVMPFWDCNDLLHQINSSSNNNESCIAQSANGSGDRVPRADTAAAINPIENDEKKSFSNWNMAAYGGQISFNRKWNDADNSFAVPQTNPPTSSPSSYKRSRPF